MTAEVFSDMLWNRYAREAAAASEAEHAAFTGYLHGIFSEEQLHAPATRRDAARILHIFLLQLLKLPDEDWREYAKLKDIYDCRICANAIAQVCVRSLMLPKSRQEFGALLPFTDTEAAQIPERLMQYLV